MTQHPLTDLSVLDTFKQSPFVPGYPAHTRTFYSPVDDVPGALAALLTSASKSLVLAMYGLDDEVLVNILLDKLNNQNCFVQLTLDSSQAGGVHERKLLADAKFPASSVVTGRSEHGAIMHMKELIIDGVVLVTGSTNWSSSGETLQDNQLTVISDAYVCAEARARIDAIHANMMNKVVKK